MSSASIAKALPPNFAESVIELELLVESGKFTLETINELMFLYS